jgi:hypothetical protein
VQEEETFELLKDALSSPAVDLNTLQVRRGPCRAGWPQRWLLGLALLGLGLGLGQGVGLGLGLPKRVVARNRRERTPSPCRRYHSPTRHLHHHHPPPPPHPQAHVETLEARIGNALAVELAHELVARRNSLANVPQPPRRGRLSQVQPGTKHRGIYLPPLSEAQRRELFQVGLRGRVLCVLRPQRWRLQEPGLLGQSRSIS